MAGASDNHEYDDLTIIVPLRDNASFAFRWIAYMRSLARPFRIVLADGSRGEEACAKFSRGDARGHLDYVYIRYPYDRTYAEFYAKMTDVLSKIATPYAMIVDGDDFLLPGGLTKALDFLRAHPGHSSCRGEVVGFFLRPAFEMDTEAGVLSGKATGFHRLYDDRPINDATALGRVLSHLKHYNPTYYNVHRTGLFKECFRALRDLDLQDVFLFELLLSILSVVPGKVQIVRDLYLARQFNPACSAAITENKKGNAFDRMLAATWSSDLGKFFRTAADAVACTDAISSEEALVRIKAGYREYAAKNVATALSSSGVKMRNGYLHKAVSKAGRVFKYDCAEDIKTIRRFLGAGAGLRSPSYEK